jgi:adenylate cyclase
MSLLRFAHRRTESVMDKRIPIILGLILTCLALWFSITSIKPIRQVIERLDHMGYDMHVRSGTLAQQTLTSSPVAIIDIDDKSLQAEGRWPWPRSKLAQLVTELKAQGATVIAFDMFFAEAQRNFADLVKAQLAAKQVITPAVSEALTQNSYLFDEDSVFAQAIKDSSIVLAISFLPNTQKLNFLPPPSIDLSKQEGTFLKIHTALGYISNIAKLENVTKGEGFINIYPDADGIIRKAALIVRYQNGIYPSLALQTVMAFLDEKIELSMPNYADTKKLEGIRLGETFIPTDELGQMFIPFIGYSYTFPYYSATDVLHGKTPKDALLGKILFVGTSATGLGDLQATAVQNPYPGVEIQASIVNGILKHLFTYQPAWTYAANLCATLLIGLFCALVFPYCGPRLLIFYIIFTPPIILLLNHWLLHMTGMILSFLMPVMAISCIGLMNIIYGYLFETRRRENLRAMFGQYVPDF